MTFCSNKAKANSRTTVTPIALSFNHGIRNILHKCDKELRLAVYNETPRDFINSRYCQKMEAQTTGKAGL
ncbi:hypothetical protein KM043_007742 [Ampulex compressa]|nr:hypothetical protein KM043_007742 [Ampulex compressa]